MRKIMAQDFSCLEVAWGQQWDVSCDDEETNPWLEEAIKTSHYNRTKLIQWNNNPPNKPEQTNFKLEK